MRLAHVKRNWPRPRLFSAILRLCSLLAGAYCLASCQAPRIAEQSDRVNHLAPKNWSVDAEPTAPAYAWLDSFGSPALEALIEEAGRGNFGLEAASYRSRAAEAAARIVGAQRYPSLAASLRSGRQQTALVPFAPSAAIAETHTLALSSQWEVDLWSRAAQAHGASTARQQAAAFELESLRLSLSSQVAKSWFNAIEARDQWKLAQSSAASIEANLQTLERRYRSGLVEAFDLRLTRSQAANVRASAHSRRAQMDTSLRALETLLGRYPSAQADLAPELPQLPPPPPSGLPLELLARRPDLRVLERQLAAAVAEEVAARRNWLPSIAITASGGQLSRAFADLLDDPITLWSLFGELAQPIFLGGRLAAGREQAAALEAAQLAEFRHATLNAFREVETALQAEADLAALYEETALAAREGARAEEQAWTLYARGLIDVSAALDAQRRSLEAQSQLIAVHNRRLQNRIDLHVALGGDFTP